MRTAPCRLIPAMLAAALLLQGCVAAPPPDTRPAETVLERAAPSARSSGKAAAETFLAVAARVEPVAERICRSRRTGPVNCDITIAVDDRPGEPPNAYQTRDKNGRPYVVFTLSLIAMAQNADEIAFVMGHEAAHQIAGHLDRRYDQAMGGAILAGVLATAAGLSPEEVDKAQYAGAEVAARQYSKEFELEADALGAEIAFAAGYDPIRGAAFFDRLPDPGNRFLGTHPGNRQRKATVAETVRRLQAGG